MTPPSNGNASDELRAFVAGRGDGITIDTPQHWTTEEISGEHVAKFFGAISILLPPDSILYFEGTSIAPAVAEFYLAHRAGNAICVARDTIFPVPDVYHVSFSPTVTSGLIELAARHELAQMFDHLKGYKGESLLFSFHDAFCGWFTISQRVPSESVTKFAEALGVSFSIEDTKPRNTAALEQLLALMEDPKRFRKIRFHGDPFWRTWWRRITGR